MVMNLRIENTLHINKDITEMELTDSEEEINTSKTNRTDISDLQDSDCDSVSESVENDSVINTSLKFGIDNILREDDSSVKEEHTNKMLLSNQELSLRNIQHFNSFPNHSSYLMNPYVMPSSTFMWPLKDIGRDRQICKSYFI